MTNTYSRNIKDNRYEETNRRDTNNTNLFQKKRVKRRKERSRGLTDVQKVLEKSEESGRRQV